MDARGLISQGWMRPEDALDAMSFRPYINKRGQKCIIRRQGFIFKNGKSEPQLKEVVLQNAVQQNNLLRLYEWQEIDTAVVDVMRQPIVGIADLIANGLTRPLMGLGTSISTYEQLSDMSPADVSMTVTPSKGTNDKVAYTPQNVPVPIISKPFNIDARMLDASRRIGDSLDMTQVRVATIKVRQALEDMLFKGSSKQLAGYPIYGYTTHPERITDTAAAFGGGDFGTAGNGHKTIVGMIKALNAAGFYGPYGFYIAQTQYSQLNALIGANLSETELSVILRTIPNLRFVKQSDRLTDGEGVLVNLTPEVVDLAVGQDVTPIQWTEEGGLLAEFRVLTAAVPRIKFPVDSKAGVAHATGC